MAADASFTVEASTGFPISYPCTFTFTNTSSDYDNYSWKFTLGSGGAVIVYTNQQPNPELIIYGEEYLPIGVELKVWTNDSTGTVAMVANTQYSKAGAGADDYDISEAYANYQELDWGVDDTPPFHYENLNKWTCNNYNSPGTAVKYEAKKTYYEKDISGYDGVVHAVIRVSIVPGEQPGGGPIVMKQSDGGAILGTLESWSNGFDYEMADASQFIDGTATCILEDANYDMIAYETGWQIDTVTVKMYFSGNSDVVSGLVFSTGLDEEGLHIDFVGTPREGVSPMDVQFTDISLTEFVSWRWWFGDGQTSIEEHPDNTYTIDDE